MKNWQSWEEVKAEWMKDPKFVREYKKLEPRYRVISQMIGARIKKKITQAQLAKMVGTKQSAIARLESGSINPTVDFLTKIASGLGMKLEVQFR